MNADRLVIDGIPGLDGSYETDLSGLVELGNPNALTSRESHTIKQMTGLRFGEIGPAIAAGDSDILVALAAVVLRRLGKEYDEDTLWDAPVGRITFDIADREQDDAGPPAVTPTLEQPPSGGDSSTTDSAPPQSVRSPTGARV